MDYITVWRDDLLINRAEAKEKEIRDGAERSDALLVELVLAGDDAAFADLFERYKGSPVRSPPVISDSPSKSKRSSRSASRKSISSSSISAGITIFLFRAGSAGSRRTPASTFCGGRNEGRKIWNAS